MNELDRIREEYARRGSELAGNDRYSLFNPAQLFIIQQRQRAVLRLLRAQGFFSLAELKTLEVGCGAGGVLLEMLSFGALANRLHGTDLLPGRLAEACSRLGGVPLTCSDGQNLPYASKQFDIVMQFTVFSSVLDDAVKAHLAEEMLRVTRPNGLILWYDFWLNPTNPQTRGIRPAEIKRLFPGCTFAFQKITLAPPIARRVVPVSWGLAYWLESLRIFNSHYLVAIQPKDE
jgi:ubiquinone/menaquinone biosynthesis C-methylase UbiE